MGSTMNSMLLPGVLVVLVLVLSAQSCPSGGDRVWVELGDSCYSTSKLAMDWGTAQEYCWDQGGYLAEITSADEEALVDTFLNDGITYWLGLTDLAHEGTYRWQESHQVAGYTNWCTGCPNSSDDYDCVWKSFYDGYGYPGWHDVSCTSTFYDGYGQSHALCEAAK